MTPTTLSPQLRIHEYAAMPATALQYYTAVDTAPKVTDTEDDVEPARYWSGVIGMESLATGDGRIIEENALEWATPIPLRYVREDTGGHVGAVVVGRILSISRGEGGRIEAYGDFDFGSDDGREAARLVTRELMTGVSMDLDSVAFEVRVSEEVIAAEEALWEKLMSEEDGGEAAAREVDEDGRVTVHAAGADDEIMVTTAARVRAATLVSVPAFAEAVIGALAELPADESTDALVASAAPIEPPTAWFSRPEANGPSALTITDDGQVYGHLATWEVCHIADPNGSGVCVMAPKSMSDYAYFHTGAVKTGEGSLVTTGVLRFETKHAGIRANATDASAHYDHTGLAGADIHAVDGKYGVWVSGALRPGVTPEQVRTLRASPLSGDWRYVGGHLELVGALAVNQPGFPIPRTQGLVASGELQGLVAAGMLAPAGAVEARNGELSTNDAAYLTRMIDRERSREHRELRSRVQAATGRRRVEALAKRRQQAEASIASTERY